MISNEPSVQEILQRDQREIARLVSRPNIEHLADAVVDGKFVVPVGGRLVIDRLASVLPCSPWLDTRCYVVKAIDHETGNVALFDEELWHNALSNFKQGLRAGYIFKVAPAKGSWTSSSTVKVSSPKASKPTKSEPKGTKPASGEVRRVYSTKGVIHTRIKGIAYLPKVQAESSAKDGDRLMFKATRNGDRAEATFRDGTKEVWFKKEKF